MLDVNYTHSFNNPIDNTVVGSTALARNNEIQVSFAGIGGEFNYENAHAKIMRFHNAVFWRRKVTVCYADNNVVAIYYLLIETIG